MKKSIRQSIKKEKTGADRVFSDDDYILEYYPLDFVSSDDTQLSMKKSINQIVKDALDHVYISGLPLYRFETWHSGYIDNLTDQAIGVFRLDIDIADDILDAPTTQAILEQIAADVKTAPDYTRYDDHHFILYWLDASAISMTEEYGKEQ